MTTEKSENDTSHTNVTNCCQSSPANQSNNQCRYLQDFKQFLCEVTIKDAVTNNELGGGGTSVVGGGLILTRNTTETYPVTDNELNTEVLMYVWHKLQKCPEHYRLGLAKLVEEEINRELKNTKVREDLAEASKTTKADPGGEEDSTTKCFDLAKLQKFISQYIEKTFCRLSDNSREDILKNYSDCIRDTKSTTFPAPLLYSVMQIKNKHRKMEDRHICLPRFSELFELETPCSFFGVFDGHSGSVAATYAANQIPSLVAKHLREIKMSVNETETDYYRDVLEASFINADANFVRKSLGSGTTAVCALLKHTNNNKDHLYVAWVGDSRCLLVSPTASLQLVKPHKPDSMDERKRIESNETGGAVVFVHGQWRVNGIINVSRSIGDHSVKAVIAEPDFVDIPLQPTHDFLILGSDGLWDHVSETELVKCTYKALADVQQHLDDIPKHLIELAKQGDSQDNITVVLVLLKERSNIIENYKQCMEKSE